MRMKTLPLCYRRIAALCIFLFFAAGRAQTVIRVMNGYVLLDSDRGVKKTGDEIAVERITDGGNVETGRIRIMLLRENKASGKIVAEPEPYRIEVGDVVKNAPVTDSVLTPVHPVPLAPAGPGSVVKVIPGYALVDPGREHWDMDDMLVIRRQADRGMSDIGEARVIRLQDGKAAARIIREIEPYRIAAGDAVSRLQSEADIDTYFFGRFDGK